MEQREQPVEEMSEEAEEKRYTIEDWYNTGENRRVELINGKFYDKAAPNRIHQGILGSLLVIIGNYIENEGKDCEVYPGPFGVQLTEEEDTALEPDISVICDRNKLNDRGCLGAPDWIIEIISPSTASIDYIKKLELYMNAGVREYWIINPETGDVTVYNDIHTLVPRSFSLTDKINSYIFQDLTIDFNDIMKRI